MPNAIDFQPVAISFSAPATIEAAAVGAKAQRRIRVEPAYTGGPLKVPNYHLPVIVDLAGVVPADNIVANLDHDPARRVGHVSEVRNDGRTLSLYGPVSAASDSAREFVDSSDAKFPWSASIEALPTGPVEEVAYGKQVVVNGQTFTGPLLIARTSQLYGVALCSKGADKAARAIAATQQGRIQMDQTAIAGPADNLDAIKASWSNATWHYPTDPDDIDPIGPHARANDAMIEAVAGKITFDKYKETLATEQKRDAELYKMRSNRPKGPAIHASTNDSYPDVIEAAFAASVDLPDREKHYQPRVLEAADKHYRGIGLQQMLIMAAVSNGYQCRAGERITNGNVREIMQYAFPPFVPSIRAAFSTLSLPGILSNVANKELLTGYMEEDQSWREVSTTKTVQNFHAHTSYRLLDDMEYEFLPKGGSITHAALNQEESYTRQARTYAKMASIDRVDIINDDLGAFDDLRTRIGRGASRKFNKIFWAAFMNNASFFTSGRGNYLSGATTNLGLDGVGLNLAEIAFRALRAPAGERIGGKPVLLLHPPELSFNARKLYASTSVIATGDTDSSQPSGNVFEGLYKPLTVDWLSDSDYTGYSDKAWYLLRSPNDLAAVVVSFLFGQQTPTVEMNESTFNTLGIELRGFHDFGCDLAEWLCGMKVKGEA